MSPLYRVTTSTSHSVQGSVSGGGSGGSCGCGGGELLTSCQSGDQVVLQSLTDHRVQPPRSVELVYLLVQLESDGVKLPSKCLPLTAHLGDHVCCEVVWRPCDGRPEVVTTLLAPGGAHVSRGNLLHPAPDIKAAVRTKQEVVAEVVVLTGLLGESLQVASVPAVSRNTPQVGRAGGVVLTLSRLPDNVNVM